MLLFLFQSSAVKHHTKSTTLMSVYHRDSNIFGANGLCSAINLKLGAGTTLVWTLAFAVGVGGLKRSARKGSSGQAMTVHYESPPNHGFGLPA